MPSAAYVGRVGGLAVAFGIGAALMSGPSMGSAWADEPGGSTGATTNQNGTATDPAATPGDAEASPVRRSSPERA